MRSPLNGSCPFTSKSTNLAQRPCDGFVTFLVVVVVSLGFASKLRNIEARGKLQKSSLSDSTYDRLISWQFHTYPANEIQLCACSESLVTRPLGVGECWE